MPQRGAQIGWPGFRQGVPVVAVRPLLRGRRARLGGVGHGLLVLCFAVWLGGCNCEHQATLPDAAERDPVSGLTPAEAAEVLVTVGETKITLGDYAATLLRMDPFERLRYQTEDRQKQLLDEMVEVEILAQEARRRGLHKDPTVELRVAQALRDELLADLERRVPGPESFSERAVREYYQAHESEFVEPERHRVMAIAVPSEMLAHQLLPQARGSSGQVWGELAAKHSLLRDTISDQSPELAGDLGFVSAPGTERGNNDQVPPEVREAIFTVNKVGDVVARPVASEGRYYILRLGGISPARVRTLPEAERTIRVELRRQKFLQAERKLEEDLRKKYPVVIDEEKLAAFEKAEATRAASSPMPAPRGAESSQPSGGSPNVGTEPSAGTATPARDTSRGDAGPAKDGAPAP